MVSGRQTILKIIYLGILFVFLLGCSSQREQKKYHGGVLLEQKCALCHNLKMPPDTYENEKAPPMMAVVFHLKDFMKIRDEKDKQDKFIPFIQDYVLYPSKEKSYCDAESLRTYGVMPSQKGNVTEEELEAIAKYIYGFYDQRRYLKEMQEKSAFDALPKGEQVIRKKGCFNCHDIHKDKAGPSFARISERDDNEIVTAIKNGSQGKWKDFHNMMMPPYKDKITSKELMQILEWLDSLNALATAQRN